jgi:hypothetical protein
MTLWRALVLLHTFYFWFQTTPLTFSKSCRAIIWGETPASTNTHPLGSYGFCGLSEWEGGVSAGGGWQIMGLLTLLTTVVIACSAQKEKPTAWVWQVRST